MDFYFVTKLILSRSGHWNKTVRWREKLHNTANQNNSVKNSFPCFFLFWQSFLFLLNILLNPPCPDPLSPSLSCMKTKGRFYICLDVISSPLILVSYIDPVPTPYILIYRYIQAFLPVVLHQKFNYPSWLYIFFVFLANISFCLSWLAELSSCFSYRVVFLSFMHSCLSAFHA